MEEYYILSAVLMQELFENGLFDLEEIAEKYSLDSNVKESLEELYENYYGEEL